MRIALALFVILPLAAPRAQTVLAAVRAGQWGEAETRAAAAADPLARKLVRYFRLLTPGAAGAGEIAEFLGENPGWPNQAALSRRLQDAVLAERDDRVAAGFCRQYPASSAPALLRCADALARTAPAEAEGAARRAWIAGLTDAAAETAFLRRWAAIVTPDDQWRRFERLAWTESAAPGGTLARQALRLAPALRPVAESWLALKRDDPTAPALLAVLGEPARSSPALILELARWYRRAGQDRDAAAVWTGAGLAAEQSAPVDHRAAFWDERNLLARRLLRANEPAQAYAVAAAPAARPESAIDQAFLAGWIALRRLGQPAVALRHFDGLATLSGAAITQARAHYWLARAHEAGRDADAAKSDYARAAAWPTTYYGQLAILACGDNPAVRLADVHDPGWGPGLTEDRAEAFLGQEAARAAILLTAWGDPRRARAFLTRLDEGAGGPIDHTLAARLALGLGLADQAVAIARRAGREGVMLPGAGWPSPVDPADSPVIDPALTLGLIRQESSFDVQAVSPVGARGLMQLMPATASSVARRLGVAPDVAALTGDAAYNIRLGTAYLHSLLVQFSQDLPLAIAAYNAGPSRVQDWLIGNGAAPGDPKTGALDMIDWIEMIPFNETRNYVQRVIENTIIYRAQRGNVAPHPVSRAAERLPG